MSEAQTILGSITATLRWDPKVLQFEGLSKGTSEGFESPVVNSSKAAAGELYFANAQPRGGNGEVTVLNAGFRVIGKQGMSGLFELSVESLAAARTFVDLMPWLDLTAADYLTFDVVEVPETFGLDQNYPNPFNPETTINYQLPEESRVRVAVYNLLGQQVRILVDKEQPAGRYTVLWDGRNRFGQGMSSGLYIVRMNAGNFVADRKMLLLK
jgi:hypothetical protein